ncbi:XkdX family protein [Clostridium baratii]|uniref:XkdX family protein n=1 Tax=Clostridium baratii TaxID=1561 RepID=UPI0030D30E01
MNNDNFEFWKMAYTMKNGISIDMLRRAVYTKSNLYGEITVEQFKEITGEDFENISGNN